MSFDWFKIQRDFEWGLSFEFDVVSCCGLNDVEKSAYFGHLKSFFLKKGISFPVSWTVSSKKNHSWNKYFIKKSLAKITLKQKTSKSFYTQILRRTRFLIGKLFSLPSQKLFLKLFKAI